ncbi:MAG: alpha-hydroxy-acid oxidizing protein [Chloroflexi bacterium]|nr:MAG: alpha-hydroxy-acid oxidizing protein [Chloroflexota bacterium]
MLDDLVCVADFRRAARRRLPTAIFDFVDGAAGHELTMRGNEEAHRHYALRPRLLTDVSSLDPGLDLLGRRLEVPLLLGPSGMQRLVHPEGELAAVRAAARAGAGYVLSVGASRTLEEVADAGRGAVLWFQVYLWESRRWTEDLVRRARDAGYAALCVTVDSKAPGARKYRDLRNGLVAGPRIDLRSSLDAVRRPRWLAGYLLSPPIRAVHLVEDDRLGVSLFRSPAVIQRRMSPAATWDEIGWLRRAWDGPLVVKGVLTPEDAREAFARGADAIICSNHGGRVLDGDPPTLLALPAVAEVAAAAGRTVLVDGGIRTGADVVRAIALGAAACLVARPFWWGLAAGGEAGVHAVLDILRRELVSTMTMLGRPTLGDVDGSAVERMPFPFPSP